MITPGHLVGRGLRTARVAGDGASRPRLLDEHVLLLSAAGYGVSEVDFVAHPCRPGTVLWARPGQVISPPGVEATLLVWPDGYLPPLAVAEPGGPVRWQLGGEDEDAVIDGVSQLVVDRDRHGSTAEADALLRHQLAALLLRLSMVSPADQPIIDGADGVVYQRFRGEVEAHFAACHQVATYADRIGCSVRTLTRACLAATGRSAKQVLDDRIALQAKRLLAATDLTVAAVGQLLGFTEATHFCRTFLRTTETTPGAFRAAVA